MEGEEVKEEGRMEERERMGLAGLLWLRRWEEEEEEEEELEDDNDDDGNEEGGAGVKFVRAGWRGVERRKG